VATDGELIQAYLKGDEAAFETLYLRHRERLYWYLNELTERNQAQADDLFQEVWKKALSQLSRYRDDGFFGAWLCRIGRNARIDQFRREERRGAELPLEEDGAPELPDPKKREPWQDCSDAELGKKIDAALRLLPMEQREVFELRRQERSFREIAAIQGCSINTALGRMQYALKRLRMLLREEYGGVQ